MRQTPVGKIPPAFLSLLQLKSTGANPDGLADTYQPTLEMAEWLALQEREMLVLPIAGIAAPGVYSGFQNSVLPAARIPDGEVWYLWNATCVTGLLALDSSLPWVPSVGISPSGGVVTRQFQLVPSVPFFFATPPVNVQLQCGGPVRRFFGGQGEVFGVFIPLLNMAGAGPTGANLYLEITRLRV